jgi:L,D-peptidoglycan transpeptidase YkuD (ErfK/YbiS/YcfS/YnhG family)
MDLFITPESAIWGISRFSFTYGKEGFTTDKREGDKKTPVGIFPFRRVFYRPDRISKPVSTLPIIPIDTSMGWCDDPLSQDYNQLITLPFKYSHEKMWREDHLYDLVIEVAYNDAPIISGKGSAIFIHVMRSQEKPTLGCIGLELEHLVKIVSEATDTSKLIIENSS